MAEESDQSELQDGATFWDFGSMQKKKDPNVRDGRQDSQLAVSG